MLYPYRRFVLAALAIAFLALGLRSAVPLVPLLWQGSCAEALVVDRQPLSPRAYRATFEFPRGGEAELVRVSRDIHGGRRARWLHVGNPVRIVHLPENPQNLAILSYPGADWLPPVILLSAGAFFAFVWRRTPANRR